MKFKQVLQTTLCLTLSLQLMAPVQALAFTANSPASFDRLELPLDEIPAAAQDNQKTIKLTEENDYNRIISKHTGKKEYYDIKVSRALNEIGEIEYVYTQFSQNNLFSDKVILIGRDTDGNGYPDAWFTLDDTGILESYDLPSSHEFGWDVVEKLIKEKIQPKPIRFFKYLFSSDALNIVKAIAIPPFSNLKQENFITSLTRKQLYLLDLGIRANRMLENNPRDPKLSIIYRTLSEAWMQLDQEMGSHVWKTKLQAAAESIGLTLITMGVGYVAQKTTTALSSLIGPTFLKSKALQLALDFTEKYTTRVSHLTKKYTFQIRDRISFLKYFAQASVKETIQISIQNLTKLTPIEQSMAWLIELHAKSSVIKFLAKSMAKGLFVTKNVAISTYHQLSYITYVQFLQLITEATYHHLWSKDHIIVGSEEEMKNLKQNMGFMTLETAQMATVSHMVPKISTRMQISGVISLVNSTSMSLLIKNEKDPYRILGDVGFQVVVSNAETQVDFWALKTFEEIAIRQKRPGLKLIGWAIITAETLAGFTAYSYATNQYESKKLKNKNKASLDNNRQIELKPIYMPI